MCRTYGQVYPDLCCPASRADIAKPIPGGGPIIDDGWGKPFRYALVPNAAGELEPHIWSERTYNGRTTLHGAKLAATERLSHSAGPPTDGLPLPARPAIPGV